MGTIFLVIFTRPAGAVMIFTRSRNGGEGEERGLRKGAERGYRDSEKRDKRELS